MDLAAAGASGWEAEEAGAEATPPAIEEEVRARPENQEVEAGGEVIVTATARLTAWASGWLAVGGCEAATCCWAWWVWIVLAKAWRTRRGGGDDEGEEVENWKWIGILN